MTDIETLQTVLNLEHIGIDTSIVTEGAVEFDEKYQNAVQSFVQKYGKQFPIFEEVKDEKEDTGRET